MRDIAVVIQNSNEKVTVQETIKAVKGAGFNNVFIQWYDENWEYSQEEQFELCKKLGLNIIFAHLGYQKINSMTISFGVAPRINACGRIGQAEEALKLFLTQDILEAQHLTDELNEYNRVRQEIEKKIYEDAIEKIEKNNMNEKSCIVLAGENWHHGVIRNSCIKNHRYVF